MANDHGVTPDHDEDGKYNEVFHMCVSFLCRFRIGFFGKSRLPHFGFDWAKIGARFFRYLLWAATSEGEEKEVEEEVEEEVGVWWQIGD